MRSTSATSSEPVRGPVRTVGRAAARVALAVVLVATAGVSAADAQYRRIDLTIFGMD